jgi:exosortase A
MNTTTSTLTRTLGPKLWPAVLITVCVLLLFRDTVAEMMATYDRSGTFAHAYLVPPIVIWLIWRLRHAIAPLPVKPEPWVLLGVAAACLLWLAGELAVVNAASHLALVTILVLMVPAIYGWAITKALLFPLLFLYFAVPIGMFMVPIMMEGTADFTVAALQLTGIPVYREGLQFVIPSGNWSVVEACSGVRYLIASFMVGTLFAYLNYKTTKRRLMFVAVSLMVPIVANWLRAYMIVLIGHYSGNTLAVGVDHLVYGWVFFGLVIGLMFMIGARWAEPNDPPGAPATALVQTEASLKPTWATAAGLLAVVVVVQAVLWQLDKPRSDVLAPLQLPSELGNDWQSRDRALTAWVPAYSGARATDKRDYAAGNDVVGVWAGYYREQGRLNKMVTSNNELSQVEKTQWAQVSRSSAQVDVAGRVMPWRSTVLRGPGEPGSATAQRLLVWHTYWINGEFTTSDVRAKLLLALNRVLGKGDDSAVLIIYTPLPDTGPGVVPDNTASEAVLRRFVAAQLPLLVRPLERLAQGTSTAKP